jgi:LysR family glycine cleavage system transcriptional activator
MQMNPRTLAPSMSSLLAMESCARLGSFTRAAEELSLSQSAVSRQIQTLEQLLSVALFDRVGRHVELTDAGRSYAKDLSVALTAIKSATTRLVRSRQPEAALHLAVLPTFGTKWLLPRLSDFYRRHPSIQIHIHARIGEVDLQHSKMDAAICVGNSPWNEADAYPLFPEFLVPVVSGTVATEKPIRSINDLKDARLLRSAARPELWFDWLSAQGAETGLIKLGPQYELTSHLLQAVSAGLGVGLVPGFLIEDELANGSLKIPLDVPAQSSASYYLLAAAGKSQDVALVAFREWLLGQL